MAPLTPPRPHDAMAAPLHGGDRQELERERMQAEPARRDPPQWPTPTLLAAGPLLDLYDPKGVFEILDPPPQPRLHRVGGVMEQAE